MSASLIGWIWRQELSASAKLVLFALNEHTNIGEHGDWRVFPGQERVAKMCGMSKRSVIRAMQELSEAGVIVVAHQRDDKGRQLQNLYWLQAPKLIEEEGCQNVTPQCKNDTPGGDKLSHKSLNKNPLNKRFIAPTVSEVSDYFSERGADPAEAERFVDFYESKGWLVGKVKMKCWKSSVRNWIRGNKLTANPQPKPRWI